MSSASTSMFIDLCPQGKGRYYLHAKVCMIAPIAECSWVYTFSFFSHCYTEYEWNR